MTPEDWQEKSLSARDVALTLNQQTVDHWLALLRKHLATRALARP
jgi:hypothetical protein